MLVLSRKSGESLVIDHQVEVHILEVKGEAVKVGIDAPRHIAIHRKELVDTVRKANRTASRQPKGTSDKAFKTLANFKRQDLFKSDS